MAVADWSVTPASNLSISGIDISEGCAPGNINDAIRTMMADVKTFSNALPSTDTYLTKSAAVFTGTQPTYTGRGAYLHYNSSSFASGRVFFQAAGGSVPTGMVAGDVLLEY